MKTIKTLRRLKIKRGSRSRIFGTATRPRLSIYRSNKQIYSQLINDVEGNTLAEASSLGFKEKITKKEIATKVGELIAQRARGVGIDSVVFDRNGYLYHGRIKELANAARKGGLKF